MEISPPILHMVWTRSIDGDRMVGRLKVAQALREALAGRFTLRHSVLRSIAEDRSPGRIAGAATSYLGYLAKGRPLPLQSSLYAGPREIDRVLGEIAPETRAVYLDGVRCVTLLERLRRERPHLAIITDLDDLMSRRMRLLLELGQGPTAGYLETAMPGLVKRALNARSVGRGVLRYEHATLGPIERRIASLSDHCVLVSSEDAALLADGRIAVSGIGPPASIVRDPSPLAPGPLRFVFVGTDALRQNQLTIDRLLDLWARHRIATPLAIYGEQRRRIELPQGVSMPGYAPTIDAVYDDRSILLSPSYLAGGIKTKVLEAFAHGAPVVGNAVTFEGMALPAGYPMLVEDEEETVALLRDPDARRTDLHRAAMLGAEMIRAHHDSDRFAERWITLFETAIARRAITSGRIPAKIPRDRAWRPARGSRFRQRSDPTGE